MMAFSLDARASVTLSLVDFGLNATTRTIEMTMTPATDTVQDVVDRAMSLWATMDPLTLAACTNVAVTINNRERALVVPAAGNVEENAEISMVITGQPNKRATFAIPAPASALFVASTGPNANVVDTANASLGVLHSLFQTGNEFYLSDGEQVAVGAANLRGKRVHRKSRRG